MSFIEFDEINNQNYCYTPYFEHDVIEGVINLGKDIDILEITKLALDIESTINKTIKTPYGVNLYKNKLSGLCAVVDHKVQGRLEFITTENNFRMIPFNFYKGSYINIDKAIKNTHKLSCNSNILHSFCKKTDSNNLYFSALFICGINH